MLFQYTNIDRSTIRLVKFLPYSTPTNIYLSLEHQSRYYESNVRYNALSYVCGDINDRKSITMGGRTFLVTSNLFAALSAMVQHHDISTRFWVDSICINQQDPIEKSMEANQIWRVFSHASKVMSWIGPRDESTGQAFDALDQGNSDGEGLVASSILNREYFHRAWVRAEILSSRSPEIICGEHKCDFSSLKNFFRDRDSIKDVPASTLQLIKSHGTQNQKPSISLPQQFQSILTEYATSHTSDPRDRIFALLNDSRIQALDSVDLPGISYSFSVETIALRVIRFYDKLSLSSEDSHESTSTHSFLTSLAKPLDLPDSMSAFSKMIQGQIEDSGSADETDRSGPVMREILGSSQPGQKSRY